MELVEFTVGGSPRCTDVHPVYQVQCERKKYHFGPCAHVIYWNEELD